MPCPYRICLIFALVALVSGCGDSTTNTTVVTDDSSMMNGHISLSDGAVALKPDGVPQAVISAAGDFTIDGKAVVVTPEQRSLLKNYYGGVVAIRDHGLATGAAAAGVAGTALSSVAKGLANGETKNIDADVSASTAKVQAQATQICSDLSQLHATQQTLTTQLDAFKPYAVVNADEAEDCLRNNKGSQHDR